MSEAPHYRNASERDLEAARMRHQLNVLPKRSAFRPIKLAIVCLLLALGYQALHRLGVL